MTIGNEYYTISGYPPTSEKDIQKYRRSMEPFKKITDIIDRIISTHQPSEQDNAFLSTILVTKTYSPISELLPEKIQKGLIEPDDLNIRQALKSNNPEIVKAAAELIYCFPVDQITELIQITFESKDPETIFIGARTIDYAPKDQKDMLRDFVTTYIKQTLQSQNPQAAKVAAKMIRHAPENQKEVLKTFVTKYIKQTLQSQNQEAAKIAVELIPFVPDIFREELIQLALESKNPEIVKNGAKMISHTLDDRRKYLIQLTLESKDPEIVLIGTKMIWYAPKNQQSMLYNLVTAYIERNLLSQNPKAAKIAAKIIPYATENLRDQYIQIALESANPIVATTAAGVIYSVPEQRRANLISMALLNSNPEVSKMGASMIQYAPKRHRAELIKLALKINSAIIDSPLYTSQSDIRDIPFARRPFPKTGSETTLLGGIHYEKVIIRTIPTISLLAWKKAFESTDIWTHAGFEYVPVEPIIRAYQCVNNPFLTRVYTGVLDCNLEYWKIISNNSFSKKLEEQKNKIANVLEKLLYINHCHLHDKNFVLRFYRKEDGSADLTTCPRIYVIDFDIATFS